MQYQDENLLLPKKIFQEPKSKVCMTSQIRELVSSKEPVKKGRIQLRNDQVQKVRVQVARL